MTMDTSRHIGNGVKWHRLETLDFIFVDKACGQNPSHFVESWQQYLNTPLFPIYALDKNISGAQVFAKTPTSALRMRTELEKGSAHFTFWFLTDARIDEADQIEANFQMTIPQTQQVVPAHEGFGTDSKLVFRRLKRSPYFQLWQVTSPTADTEQIRKHASQLGLPVLGDTTNGGTVFARLCLHAFEINLPGEKSWQCPAPRIFERLGLLKSKAISEALTGIDHRQRQFDFLGQGKAECLRLLEFESEGLQLDLLGSQLWLQWFREADPTVREQAEWSLISRILGRELLIQKRWNRGQQTGPAPKWRTSQFLPVWTAQEQGVTYEFRADSGESHGLFLDQRLNRERVAQLSPGKSLLNLFAYTGGFSVIAALAGATQVTTVDLSAAAIAWSQRNFELNPQHHTELDFFTADTFFFLERAQKKQRRWDLIVCDPPIFSRGHRVFRIEKDLIVLLKLCKSVLAPQGTLFFSTHFEQWTFADIEKILRKGFPGVKIERGQLGPDVPQPPSSLKSFFLRF